MRSLTTAFFALLLVAAMSFSTTGDNLADGRFDNDREIIIPPGPGEFVPFGSEDWCIDNVDGPVRYSPKANGMVVHESPPNSQRSIADYRTDGKVLKSTKRVVFRCIR